jgi:hypothetical protein
LTRTSYFTGASAKYVHQDVDNNVNNSISQAVIEASFDSPRLGKLAHPGLITVFLTDDSSFPGAPAVGGAIGCIDPTYVPEPSTITLLGLGLIATLQLRRKQS